MYSIEHLFSLVNSMSKSEKRYFRLTTELQIDGQLVEMVKLPARYIKR